METEKLDFAFKHCACLNLRKATRKVMRHFDEILSDADLNSSQFILLFSIHRNNGITQKDLAEQLALQQSSLSRSLAELKRRGWTQSHGLKIGTKKLQRITLTMLGIQKLEEASPFWEQGHDQVMNIIDHENWSMVLDRLDRLHF